MLFGVETQEKGTEAAGATSIAPGLVDTLILGLDFFAQEANGKK